MARLTTTKAPAKKSAVKAAPSAAKTVAKNASAAAKKPATSAKRASAGATKTSFTPQERYRMIAEAAYYRAERHSFMGDPVQDWIEAEREINTMLSGKKK
jgi:hypothetical protein